MLRKLPLYNQMSYERNYERIQNALFQRFYDNIPWRVLASKVDVSEGILRRCYSQWKQEFSGSQSMSLRDMQFPKKSPGRRTTLTAAEWSTTVDAILYYAKNNTLLSQRGVMDLVEEMITLLSGNRHRNTGFVSERLSNNWTDHFLERHSLRVLSVQVTEQKKP